MDKNLREIFWKKYVVDAFNNAKVSQKLEEEDYSEGDSHYLGIKPDSRLKEALDYFGATSIGLNIGHSKVSCDILFYDEPKDNFKNRNFVFDLLKDKKFFKGFLEKEDRKDERNTGCRLKHTSDLSIEVSHNSFEESSAKLVDLYMDIYKEVIRLYEQR